jgi:hypothetical protein
MGALGSIYLKLETLETIVKTIKAKNEAGISIDVSIDDKSNQYGQNISAYVSQTKEQREAKVNKYYVGNGKVLWTDGTIKTAVKPDQQPAATSTPQQAYQAVPMPATPVQSDLPF